MRKLLFCVLFSFSALSYAQQEIQLTQNMFNKFSFNPAFAGSTGNLNATLLHRSQWVEFDGSPTTQILMAELPAYQLSGGVGLQIINDNIGNGLNFRQFTGTYAFQSKVQNDWSFGLGLSGGIVNIVFDYDLWKTPSGGNGGEDDNIPDEDASAFVPDIGVGGYLRYDNYVVSVSAKHIAEFEAELAGGKNARLSTTRHLFLYAESTYELSRDWDFSPSVFVKTADAQSQIDFSANFFYQELINLGMSYRNNDAVAFLLGYRYKDNIQIGYAYDFTVSELAAYQFGSHELYVRYVLPIKAPASKRTRYRNNRFL